MVTKRARSGSCIARNLRHVFLAAFLAVGLSAGAAELKVLVDQDVNSASGCTVATPSGDFKGAETVFTATVDTTVTPPRVTGVTGQACANPATNALAPPVTVSAGGWNVGVGIGTGGTNVIEVGLPLPPGVAHVRMGVLYIDGSLGTDALIATPANTSIIVGNAEAGEATEIPTLSGWGLLLLAILVGCIAFFYRGNLRNAGTAAVILLAFVATLASAAIVLDGAIGDWAGTAPINDPMGDAPDGADIAALYARIEGSTLFVRADVKTGAPPVAVADPFTATPGITLDVPAGTGLLANDARGTPAASIASYGAGSLGGAVTDHAVGTTTAVGTGGSLTVQADGRLAFVPPSGFTGSFTFDYRLANAIGASVATVTIAARIPPAFTSANNATFTVGKASSFTVAASGSPAPTLSLAPGALPGGVTFNAATGILSGTPAAGTTGSYVLAFTAANGVNPNATQAFTLTVNEGAAITSANAVSFTVGTAGTFSITTSGSPAAATISVTGALPSGVAFTNNGNGTATLAGTAAAATGGTYPLTISASNGVGAAATQAFTLTVNQPPAITSASSTTFTVGNAGSFTVAATGFPAPALALTGALPSGVTFNASTGVLSGTAAAGTSGAYPLTITASNGIGSNATQSFTLTVNQGAAITSANAATFIAGAAGTFTVTTSGAPTAATIGLTGALPAGVTFVNNGNGTAVLSGTPALGTFGTYPLTISASNGVGAPGTQSFTLTVTQAPAITSANAATFTVGGAGTFTVTTTGFPASNLAATGALPSGVTFVSNGNGTATLAGTPGAGTGGSYPLTITANNGVGGGAAQGFTLTVQQPPVAAADAYTTVHDAPLNATTVLANDTGVPAPTLASVTGSGAACSAFPCAIATANGTASVNADGTFSYVPAAAFAGTDGFTYTISNVAGTSGAAVTIDVTNIAPVVDLNGPAAGIDFGPASFVEGAGAVAIVDPAQLSVSDTDHITLARATLVLTNALDGASESIALTCATAAPGCSGAIQAADVVLTTDPGPPATATITITSAAPLADYQALLRTLTYVNASLNPSTTQRDVTVTVNDGIVDSVAAHATVAITGVNNAPTITAPASVTTPVDTAFTFAGTVSVADADAGTAPVQVTLNAAGGTVTLASTAGLAVTGNGTASVTATGPIASQNAALNGLQFTPGAGFSGAASLVVGIDDQGNTGIGGAQTAGRTIAITVNQAPTITSAAATTFTVGAAGTFAITTSAIPAATTISETGALPSGVTFVNNGNGTATLAGTPGAGTGGTYPITITASNGVPPNATQSFTLTVNQAPAITSVNNATFTVGSAGSFSVTSTGFPNATYAVTGTLPSGVTLNATSGVLSGTPGAGTGGTYPVTITASNGVIPDATQSFTLTVQQAPAITSGTTTTFTAGAPGTFTITTSATPTAATIGLTGVLPAGVTFTNNGNGTATIAGTPGTATGGTYPLTITASNGVSPAATQPFTLNVIQAPAFTSAASTSFTIGTAGTFTVTTTGVPASVITRTGTLPSGVTFVDNGNGTATLSGTPAAGTNVASPYAQLFSATNLAGTALQNFNLAICGVVGASPATLPQPTRTNAYSTTLAGTGGTAPYSFSLASGALPTGLALGSTGTISGTVSGSGTFTFAVGVTDAAGCAGSTSYTVTVNEPPVANADSFETVGNTLLEVAATSATTAPRVFVSGNVLANDNDGNGGAPGVGLSITNAGTFATANGSITIAAGGTFNYLPNAGFTGTDTFAYTVSDGIGTGTGTISINVLTQRVWYVKNDAVAGSGTSASPFNTLAAAVGASAANDTLYVFAGDGTTANQNAGAVLKAGQRLIGEGVALDVVATVNGAVNPTLRAAGSRPLVGNSAGNGVTLASANTVRGLDIGASSGTALFGSSVGALVANNASVNTTGQALDLTGVGVPTVNVALDSVTSTGGARNVSLAGLGGTVSLGTGALSGATGNAFDVSGGTAAISYAGTVANTATNQRVVSVANKTGGSVAFSGGITSSGTNPAGVVLTSNTGAAIDFSGGLALSTGTNAAFTATGGGTVTASQNNGTIVNTLATTTATALNVANTTIGATGLTFRSISSSGGSAAGIILDTTGAVGGLAVVGDGANTALGGNGSGGTIANKSGANGTPTQGTGIYLNSTRSVVLRRMAINGTQANYGIHGYNVNGFTLEFSTVSGTLGDAASLAAPENYGEGAVYFGNATTNGLATSGTFTSNVISGGRARNLSVVNTTGSSTLTIKGNQFGLVQNFSDANQSLAVEARGTATVSATLGDLAGGANTFAGSPGDQVNFTGQTGTSMTVTMLGNTLDNTHLQNAIGGGGLTLATQGTMNFTVQGNSIAGADGSAITLQLASLGTLLSGKVDGNTIGKSGVSGSGSKTGNGIFGSYAGTGTASVTISNNTIRQYLGNAGLFFDNTGGSYTANFTITNNLVNQPGPLAFAGLALTNGSPGSTDTVHVCADIRNNDFSAGDPANINDIIVGASGAATGHAFNLPGYVGTTLAQVQSFIQNNNSLPASTTVQAYVDAPVTPAAFTGTGTTCPTPP